MMGRRMSSWLVLACCALVVAARSQDHVLRFLSHDQMAEQAKAQNENVIVSGSAEESQAPKPASPIVPVSSLDTSVVCPGGASQCPDGNTCCLMPSGGYGCCPKPNAVCCTDDIHCCPSGYTCNLTTGTCTMAFSEEFSLPLETKKPALPRVAGGGVVCPGGKAMCKDGQTCCVMQDGNYGCCPYQEAVCCSDHVHCCPAGYTCDVAAGTCHTGQDFVPLMVKAQSTFRTPSNIICPDQKAQCGAGQTCCPNTSGGYGCCPTPNATCCSDCIHCCPQGYKCNLAQQTCYQGLDFIPMMVKGQSTPRNTIICPDGQSQCADGQTCCKLSSGQYGCCPLPKAVCCSDGLHCCRNGYTCDVSAGTCTRGQQSLPWEEKQPATFR